MAKVKELLQSKPSLNGECTQNLHFTITQCQWQLKKKKKYQYSNKHFTTNTPT